MDGLNGSNFHGAMHSNSTLVWCMIIEGVPLITMGQFQLKTMVILCRTKAQGLQVPESIWIRMILNDFSRPFDKVEVSMMSYPSCVVGHHTHGIVPDFPDPVWKWSGYVSCYYRTWQDNHQLWDMVLSEIPWIPWGWYLISWRGLLGPGWGSWTMGPMIRIPSIVTSQILVWVVQLNLDKSTFRIFCLTDR